MHISPETAIKRITEEGRLEPGTIVEGQTVIEGGKFDNSLYLSGIQVRGGLELNRISTKGAIYAHGISVEQGSVRLQEVKASDAFFCGANIGSMEISGARLRNLNLSGANIRSLAIGEKTEIERCDFRGIVMNSFNLCQTKIEFLFMPGIECSRCEMNSVDCDEARLDLCSFDTVSISDSNLEYFSSAKSYVKYSFILEGNIRGVIRLEEFEIGGNLHISNTLRGVDLTGVKCKAVACCGRNFAKEIAMQGHKVIVLEQN